MAVAKSQNSTGHWLEGLSIELLTSWLFTSPSRTHVREREKQRKGGFKKAVHTIVEVGKSKICKVGWQAGDPGESCSLTPQAACGQNYLFSEGGQSFYY